MRCGKLKQDVLNDVQAFFRSKILFWNQHTQRRRNHSGTYFSLLIKGRVRKNPKPAYIPAQKKDRGTGLASWDR